LGLFRTFRTCAIKWVSLRSITIVAKSLNSVAFKERNKITYHLTSMSPYFCIKEAAVYIRGGSVKDALRIGEL
jgi:hypothetical protein